MRTRYLRHAETLPVIPTPERFESSGYRAYPPETVDRIEFIQQAQQLGFTLVEIKELLALRADDEASCAEIRNLARRKADEVRDRIRELREILEGLEALAELCPGDVPVDSCPLVEVLSRNN